MSTPQRAAASLMEYEVRAAGLDHVPFCADAWHAMMNELGLARDGFVPNWRDRLTAHFATGIREGSHGWFVAAAGRRRGGDRGRLSGPDRDRRNPISAHRDDRGGVYVVSDHRRAGLARKLVTRTIQWARERGCSSVRLQASPLGERLYRSLGFEVGAELILKLGS